ncbi:indolepyruvate ferredoxin oxidoreductase family protein [Candidatus Poriferisodalis sp.]|uniref:indolepyruvate ferredoxin oxidoreductase family protein n=1 Tax=Candidatus Poriferisodalis sp. TaxID=3101277 RepID=UPI003B0209C6
MALADFKLEDRFDRAEGDVAMSGVQALLRVLLDQLRADRRDGLNNAAMVSGYRGSPLGGIDSLMLGNAEELAENNITFQPGLNEDLGATVVWGSQLANRNFEGSYDGVLGMWYGKAPGVDRSGDAIRHANVCGVDPKGGVLLVAGDDPASKSSTLASESEPVLIHYQTPILYPGSVQEVIDYGRWGYELSRYSGFWTALKIVTNVADGYSTVEVGPGRVSATRPAFEWEGKPWAHTQQDALFGPNAVRMELEIHEGRMVAVEKFVAENKLNRQTVTSPNAKVGLIAAGKTYYDLREALDRMGLREAELSRRGIRILKPAVVWPFEPTSLREFARGLDVIVVVEEKRSIIESLARELLYGMPDAPRILGKRDAQDQFWFPGHGEIDADLIARKVRPFLVDRFGSDGIGPAVPEHITIPLAVTTKDGAKAAGRTPGFCSGCPHNRSTWVPEGSEAGGGIGCHGMAAMTPTRNVRGTTQMGGEGVQWVGAAPFVTMEHRFQNIGDGTFHHSGSLAVRQAIAAGTNITYKILYNAAVAMTGGQDVDGGMEVPELTRSLHAEGAAKVLVVADDPGKYPADAQFAPDTDVWHRDRLDEAQRLLRDIEGCTVLIYDQACAAELRRDRKRGKVAEPKMRVFINEAVCEGCGDCGEKSSCLSVQPVETEFGRKTAIHQSSCNKDFTCLDGDCPAFIEVVPGGKVPTKATAAVDEIGDDLPEPDRLDEGNILMMGIGGTGVVTVNQMLATAALLDGKQANGLDQTGLAQKGGPVVSNLKVRRFGSTPDEGDAGGSNEAANKVGVGEADAYIVFDLLSGTNPVNLEKAQAGRTVALVSSSKVPTSAMVRDTAAEFPEWTAFQRSIDDATTPERNVYFDAGTLSDNLFRSHMPANVLVLGAAYQSGVVPISATAIERAIELNGVAVEMNTQAFRIGRKIVLDPDFLATLHVDRVGRVRRETGPSKREQKLIDSVADPSQELARLLRIRVPDLVAYQSIDYAAAYASFVAQVREAEAAVGDSSALSESVARYLYKLMAYKDEYEVARLHRSKAFQQAVRNQFGDKTDVTYKLHPPIMRRMGVQRKIGLGRSGDVAFAVLARMKGLRGGALDVFGKTAHRRMERELIDEYRGMISRTLDTLARGDDAACARAVEIAELPDMIRGYEDIKEANVERFRARAAELGA